MEPNSESALTVLPLLLSFSVTISGKLNSIKSSETI